MCVCACVCGCAFIKLHFWAANFIVPYCLFFSLVLPLSFPSLSLLTQRSLIFCNFSKEFSRQRPLSVWQYCGSDSAQGVVIVLVVVVVVIVLVTVVIVVVLFVIVAVVTIVVLYLLLARRLLFYCLICSSALCVDWPQTLCVCMYEHVCVGDSDS